VIATIFIRSVSIKFSRACFLRSRPATFTVAMLVAYWGGAVGVLAIGRPCSERTSRGAGYLKVK
jgi:hypothetical protein